MFDPITLGLIGSAIGGLTAKKPLQGALMGGALGAGGGLLAGAGGAGAAATTPAQQTAGLLGLPEAAAWGPQSQSAMLAAQNEGFGATGQKLLAEAAGTKAPFGVSAMVGVENGMNTLKQFNAAAKPFGEAAGTAMAVNNLFSSQDAPIQHAQFTPQTGGQALQSLSQPQFDAGAQAEMRKKRRLGLLGGMA